MTRDYEVFEECKASKQDILNCSYSSWYGTFRRNAVESKILAVPPPFLEYLGSESIRLASGTAPIENNSDNEYSDWSDDEEQGDATEHFRALTAEVSKALDEYGAVAPKLNWSAPKDATWMLPGNSMRCVSVDDVYLLLKSSNHITHDLEFPFEECEQDVSKDEVQYELVLRKWMEVNPALEFRVFVRDSAIVGVSQRDFNYYSYLQELVAINDINRKIHEFVDHKMIPKFPNRHFIADIYIPRPFDKIYIVDINPFTRISDSLLFTWNELLTEQHTDIRLIEAHSMARFKTKEYSESQVPIDVVNASNDPEALVELAKFWHNEQKSDG